MKPNELELERPYIQQNITLTRQAYNLHQMATRAFPVEQSLTSASLPGQSGDHRQYPVVG